MTDKYDNCICNHWYLEHDDILGCNTCKCEVFATPEQANNIIKALEESLGDYRKKNND